MVQFDYRTSFFGGVTPLSQEVGYSLTIILSLFFTAVRTLHRADTTRSSLLT